MEETKKIEGVDHVREIEIEKKQEMNTCIICGKMVPLEGKNIVCGQKHLDEWKRREAEKKNKPKKREAKDLIEKVNEDPEIKKNGVVAIKKSKKIFLYVCISVLAILLIVNSFWFNVNLGKLVDKDVNTSIEVNTPIDIAAPNVPVEVNNPVNVYLNISLTDDIAEQISDQVIGIINSTNFTA